MSDDLVKRLWLHDCEGITREAADRIEELEEVLEEVDAWVEDLGHYSGEGAVVVPVFKKVKAALGKGYK